MSAVASTAAASGCVSLRAQGPRSAAPTGRAARLAVRRNAVQTESKSSKAEPSEDEIFEVLRSSHGPLYYTDDAVMSTYMARRTAMVREHFEGALGIDDFMSRVEIALYQAGFTPENTIPLVNVCRDESCHKVPQKVHAMFGHSFNIAGLGAVPTLGVTGIKAGISHSPDEGGRERYVFFSMPHIAIDSEGNVGAINRPGRFGGSSACGALCACLAGLQSGDKSCTELAEPGTHDVTDPELSILKQRLLRQVKKDNVNVEKLDLVKLTKLCERSHTSDMEQLIEAAVDTSKADYALITGVQIHNWTTYPTDSKSPDLEYIWPAQFTTVINGVKSSVSLDTIPSMTPRQIRLLANEDKVYGTPAGSVIHGTDILKRQRMATELIRKAMTA